MRFDHTHKNLTYGDSVLSFVVSQQGLGTAFKAVGVIGWGGQKYWKLSVFATPSAAMLSIISSGRWRDDTDHVWEAIGLRKINRQYCPSVESRNIFLVARWVPQRIDKTRGKKKIQMVSKIQKKSCLFRKGVWQEWYTFFTFFFVPDRLTSEFFFH